MSIMSGQSPRARHLDQKGMVSIMVTMILMLVISLIVIGFAQITRRNQRQQLDRQLSTQAFYAAESGVNDAQKLINDRLAASQPVPDKADCTNTGIYAGLTPVLDASSNVSYTCLTVDPAPTNLQYDVDDTSTVVPIQSADGSNISSLDLKWFSKEATSTPINNCPTSASGAFSSTGAWSCGYGVLRFDLVSTAGGSLDANSLRQGTMTSFIVPVRGGGGASGPINFGANTANANTRYGLNCDNTDCHLTIQNLPASNSFYMRVSSIYKRAGLQIAANNGAGTAVRLQGAQAVVDSTGKAQDVLRRIQVRVPLHGDSKNALPDNAIQTTGAICKRFAVADGYFENLVTSGQVSNGGGTPSNPLCEP